MALVKREARKEDMPAVKGLIDRYIAEDYYSLSELESLVGGQNNLFYVVTDPEMDNKVVSFFYAYIDRIDEALKQLHVKERPGPLKDLPDDTLAGVYKTASTDSEHQKMGICSSFIKELEPVIKARGADMILATALRPLGQEAPMRHIFHDHGFQAVSVIPRPWVDMYLYCPYCKRNHCICDAVFYMKRLTEGED